jgi:predicted MPP superfamily phosphohydrolase
MTAPGHLPSWAQPLALRAGEAFVQQRLALDALREARGQRKERWPLRWFTLHHLVRTGLRTSGLHARGRRNAHAIELREHPLVLPRLPAAMQGFTLLQLSDLHLDVDPDFVHTLIRRIEGLRFDACVLTGDYRFRSFGPIDATLRAMDLLRPHLGQQVWSVLGNHDTLAMVPPLEAMGIPVLLNEAVQLRRGDARIGLAGVDDAHSYRLHDIPRAHAACGDAACRILLSHTPEPYAQAAQAGFDAMLSGHTHGGQVCLPGGLPVKMDLRTPLRYQRGPWQAGAMQGYTSVGCGSSIIDVRLNSLPEVTLHRLVAKAG